MNWSVITIVFGIHFIDLWININDFSKHNNKEKLLCDKF